LKLYKQGNIDVMLPTYKYVSNFWAFLVFWSIMAEFGLVSNGFRYKLHIVMFHHVSQAWRQCTAIEQLLLFFGNLDVCFPEPWNLPFWNCFLQIYLCAIRYRHINTIEGTLFNEKNWSILYNRLKLLFLLIEDT